MEKKDRKCSLCGLRFYGYGNNPAPLLSFEERCCDDCNARLVIPARILMVDMAEELGIEPKRDDKTAKGDGNNHDLP